MNIEALLEKTLPGLGYALVDYELTAQGVLRVFIDKPEGITVDDCATVSHHLSRLFAVEDVDYRHLEVSSPGLDRVLKKEADFVRFCGENVKIRTRLPQQGRKKFNGCLKSCADGHIAVETEDGEVEIALGNIDRARLDPQIEF